MSVYQLTDKDREDMRRHAEHSLERGVCALCKRTVAPTSWMVFRLTGVVCWVCHNLTMNKP